ncbi:LysE family translocator [candidate division KSB1 bacterium]|nr:LysE family translocator [candidate division KSB1 bacterium]
MLSFFKGALVAFGLALGIGPGLVVQFGASINGGFHAGAMVIYGLYLSDLLIIMLGYYSIRRLKIPEHYQIWIGILCALIFIIFGIIMLAKKQDRPVTPNHEKVPNFAHSLIFYFIKGFLTNISNPFSLIFWTGIIGIAGTAFGFFTSAFYQFFTGLMCTAISLDLLKVFIFSRIKKFFSPRLTFWMNRVLGVAMILISFVIIYKII